MFFLLLANLALVAQDSPDPYAETEDEITNSGLSPISIDLETINVLSAGSALKSENIESKVLNFMFLWVESTAFGKHSLSWEVNVPSSGNYTVTAEILGKNTNIELLCNGEKRNVKVQSEDWSRLNLGNIQLKKGSNKIELKIQSDEIIKVSALELTRPTIEEQIIDEALSVRQDLDWFKDAGYGLMFQWTNRATPKEGMKIKDWEQKINDFDVQQFANMVEETGAAYVIWSITWGQQYISAPITSLDKLIEGRTTKRDLLGEMADQLHAKGIKLIFYYHYGYDCYHSKDPAWLNVAGGYEADKTRLYKNVNEIIAEVGNRYGDKLNGWFFDGGQRYYDSRFDGTQEGVLSASFKEMSEAARRGNEQRVLTYNSWILPRVTEYQDFYSGEGLQRFENLDEGKFVDGKHKGLMAHTCFPLEERWGHIDFNTPIKKSKYSVEELSKYVKNAQHNRYPLSINLEMYEDGSVSGESLKLLKELREIVR
ncbi:alpha-L-fucosidase [Zobellia barbeyronii]|uniref:Alpha-L-fucosidase n=1 Tax=Zobellia barbeyronii TaxID=2748009 RepID=A0ABS5WDP1_9FLAO|nr:alpha-L-fucosidase [Zobellia barbeyronii]MBT2161514.1 alpha-L-fucosidase [Zobellia barbeyronii]